MKIKDIRDLSVDELRQKEKSLLEELFRLRFRFAAGQLDTPSSMNHIRRDIARIKTVCREREITG